MASFLPHTGSWGLPDFGITERLGQVVGFRSPMSSQGGSNWLPNRQSTGQVLGQSTNTPSSSGGPGGAFPVAQGTPIGPSGPPAGYSPQASSGGGGGGGQPAGQPPMENNPGEPDFSMYDQAIASAQDALNQGLTAAESGYNALLGDVTNQGQQRTTQAQQAEQQKLGALGQQRTREEGRAENAIAQARQQAAELQQGVQARFGKSTGTGAFAGELMGRAALQNIGGIQQGIQQTMTQINQEEQNVRNVTASLLDQIKQDTDTAKNQARASFEQVRAEIASKRGELQSRKAELMMNALQDYQNLLSSIEARNTQFKQQLYLKAQQTQGQLDTFKNQALQNFQAQWEAGQVPQWNVGNQTFAALPDIRGVSYVSGSNEDEDQAEGTVPDWVQG